MMLSRPLSCDALRAVSTAALCALLVGGCCEELHLHLFERPEGAGPPETEIIIKPTEPTEEQTEIILPNEQRPKRSATRMKRGYAWIGGH